jgi:hypothetical protein
MRRDVTKDIWRAVVVAGAMLGAGGCGSSSKQAAQPVAPAEASPVVAAEAEQPAAEPAKQEVVEAEPVAEAGPPDAGVPDAAPPPPKKKRPRSGDGKPKGRGFILA